LTKIDQTVRRLSVKTREGKREGIKAEGDGEEGANKQRMVLPRETVVNERGESRRKGVGGKGGYRDAMVGMGLRKGGRHGKELL